MNKCEFIILHHTGGKNRENDCTVLSGNKGVVSCHFVIGPQGQVAKIGDPRDVLWHCGESQRGNKTNMNQYSIGIEVTGPLDDGGFTDAQYNKIIELVKHLMKTYNIPVENVLKHSDITSLVGLSEKKILWDGKSKVRKVDIAPTLWQKRGFTSFDERRKKVLA